ncbi:MAG: hypothetical protein QME87_12420 [Bacillota bacterium]|nr:hypothetical protein [Bacillota bacterium]
MASVTFEQFVQIAWAYVAQAYPAELGWMCSSRVPSGAEEWFCEYVWCVFCAGFSARVLSGRWGMIWDAYRGFSLEGEVERETILRVFGNARKVDATLRVRDMLRETPWPEFRARYLSSLEAMRALPYIGPALARHLARNTGWEVGKDDVHLRRLCARFGFRDAQEMCEAGARILGHPVGAVDYALWRYCADYGHADSGVAGRGRSCRAMPS